MAFPPFRQSLVKQLRRGTIGHKAEGNTYIVEISIMRTLHRGEKKTYRETRLPCCVARRRRTAGIIHKTL
jgi:hypothetical protein